VNDVALRFNACTAFLRPGRVIWARFWLVLSVLQKACSRRLGGFSFHLGEISQHDDERDLIIRDALGASFTTSRPNPAASGF
jgi:hypothetical protein